MNILIHWKDDYSVNIKAIDQQHKKLFDMINQLYDSYIRKEDDGIMEQILSELTDYAFVHFKNEEKYFTQFEYEDAAAHIAEHQFFLKKIQNFREETQSDELSLQYEVIVFLQEWLTRHIMVTDKKYVQNFTRNGLE